MFSVNHPSGGFFTDCTLVSTCWVVFQVIARPQAPVEWFFKSFHVHQSFFLIMIEKDQSYKDNKIILTVAAEVRRDLRGQLRHGMRLPVRGRINRSVTPRLAFPIVLRLVVPRRHTQSRLNYFAERLCIRRRVIDIRSEDRPEERRNHGYPAERK